MVQALSTSNTVDAYEVTNDVKTAVAVTMLQEQQAQQELAGSIIQDTAEISEMAMTLCKAERGL